MPVVRISDELFKEVQKYAEPLVDSFETALWKALLAGRTNSVETHIKRKPRSTGNLTPPKEFWKPILETLVEKGGQTSVEEVVKSLERKMKSQLKPGDYELNRDGTAKWVKQVHFQRLAMVHEGLLGSDSHRGVWAITNQGRQWLSEHQ
jgi:hypothetical protein